MKKLILVLCSVLLVQCTCKRTTDILGPDACPTSNFAITSPLVVKDNGTSSETNLNLATSYAKVDMAFNEIITYKVSIKGSNSNAEYIYFGKGATIQLNWYGNSTNGKYFVKDENLTITVTNICKTEALGVAQIKLTTIVGYAGFGVKVINYEDSPGVSVSSYGAIIDGSCGDSKLMTSGMSGYSASPQGGNYYQYKTTCTATAEPVAWYFGGVDFNALTYTSLGTDPTNVYLNFFARGQNNSQAQIIIKEVAGGATLSRKFLANVAPNTWKLFSVRLSDIGILDPSKISIVSFNLGAATAQDVSAQVDLDLIIFTLDKPF